MYTDNWTLNLITLAEKKMAQEKDRHKVKIHVTYLLIISESEVAQSCPTLSNPMDCSLPGSSVHGIFQAGVLEWVAIAF